MKTQENPILYREKWGLVQHTLFFLFWLQNIVLGDLLESPHRIGSNGHWKSMFGANLRERSHYQSKNYIPRAMNASLILHRYVILLTKK